MIKSLVISNYNKTRANKRAESEMLIGLVERGVEITIMTYSRNEFTDFLESKGINFIFHHPRKKISFKSISIIHRVVSEGGFDIVHLFNGKAVTNAVLAVRQLNTKVIAYYGSMKIYWHDPTAYLSYLNPQVDRIICISDAVKQQVQNQLPRWRKNRAIRIYKGYTYDWTDNVNPIDRADIDVPEDAFLIACVAGDRRIKGVPKLIKAISLLPDGLPVYIVLIGTGTDHPRHMDLIKNSKYLDRFRVLGLKPDASPYIAASDLYVQPSLSEGLGRAIIESMLLEKPTIVTSYGGSKELINKGQNGFVVKSGSVVELSDAIYKAYQERDALPEMGIRARQNIIENFGIKETIDQTYKLYIDLVETNNTKIGSLNND